MDTRAEKNKLFVLLKKIVKRILNRFLYYESYFIYSAFLFSFLCVFVLSSVV